MQTQSIVSTALLSICGRVRNGGCLVGAIVLGVIASVGAEPPGRLSPGIPLTAEREEPPSKETNTSGDSSATKREDSTGEEHDQTAAPPPPSTPFEDFDDATETDNIADESNRYGDCEFEEVAECDLAAQQSMRDAAWWSAWADWFAVFLTFLGVLLLLGTLYYTRRAAEYTGRAAEEAKRGSDAAIAAADAARKANELNREFMISEQRAWISVETPIVVDGLRWNTADRASFKVRYRITNIGQSPAFNITRHALRAANGNNHNAVNELIERIVRRPHPGHGMLFPRHFLEITESVRVELPECTIRWPKIRENDMEMETVCSFYVIGAIEYYVTVVGEQQQRYTAFTYHLTKENWGGPINIDIGCDPIPASEMRLTRAIFNGMIAT